MLNARADLLITLRLVVQYYLRPTSLRAEGLCDIQLLYVLRIPLNK